MYVTKVGVINSGTDIQHIRKSFHQAPKLVLPDTSYLRCFVSSHINQLIELPLRTALEVFAVHVDYKVDHTHIE